MTSPIPSGEELRSSLAHNGYVLISTSFPSDQLERLRQAAKTAADSARRGDWPFVRTVPKQFPPWNVNEREQGIWGVQHLLHPSMPESERLVFAESYFSDVILEAVTKLLNCKEDDLVMELYNMLVRPERDFALRWHRDDIPPTASAEDEEARLREPMMHAQWNLALYPDSSLIVVPGSHKRARTAMEQSADPFEDDMPGQRIAKMAAGDVVFYNNNILHRGVYDSKAERMTLHGSMGLTGADSARSRNILQHGVGEWAAKCDFSDLPENLRDRARKMQRRLIEMGSGEHVGFSQDD